MAFRCQALTTGFLLLAIGIAFAVLVGVFWTRLERLKAPNADIKQLNSTNGTDPDESAVALFNSNWVVSATVLASPLAIFCGLVGIISGCQQGQCITLTYMASSVLTSFTYVCLLIGSFVLLANRCQGDFEKCMKVKDQERENLVLISIIALSFVIISLSLFASCVSCKARCFCCGASSKRSIENHDNHGAVSSV